MAAVIFAFVVNKLIVFRSPSGAKLTLMREIFEFVAARIFSFGLEELGMFLLVDISPLGGLSISLPFGIALTGQIISKAILAIIVIILNYFFSKFIIFQKHRGSLNEKL